MFKETLNFSAIERPGKPLHIVFYEHLHGRASDGTSAFNSLVQSSGNGHVRAEQDLRFGLE
jgi:hypothetical protein